MKKVSKEQLKIRDEFGVETGLVFFDHISKYADWLEERYAALRIHDVVGRSEELKAEVFTLANKLAVAGEGDAAVAMHRIHNRL